MKSENFDFSIFQFSDDDNGSYDDGDGDSVGDDINTNRGERGGACLREYLGPCNNGIRCIK